MSKHVYLYSETLSAEDLAAMAERYHAAYGLPTALRTSAPDVTSPVDWAGLLDHQDEAVLRYWSAQTKRLSTMLAEAYPPLEEGVVRDSVLTLLAAPWDDDAEGTVIYRRESDNHGLAIVFPGLGVDSGGRLRLDGAALPLPPRSAFVSAEAPTVAEGGAGEVQQAIWIILKYIGEGLSVDTPIIGSIFKLLLDFLSEFSKTSGDQMDQLLDDIKKLLQDDRIQIEMDTANAVVLTWSQYEGSHFQEADLNILNQDHPDTSSPAYKAAQERVSGFVTKINDDLNGTPRLFDAVNLMRGSTNQNPDTLDFPTDAMLKFSYFMFYAGFILALGKQAWLSSKALNGNDSDVTQSLQKIVTYWSTNFTSYLNTLSTTIKQQLINRINRWFAADESPIDGNTFIFIQDGADERGHRYSPPQEWGYTGDTLFSYCGTAQAQKAWADCEAAVIAITKAYQNYMYGRIVKSASDGRTLQQEFDARVATFRENDEKYHKLAANG